MHEFIAIQLLIPGGSSSRPTEQLDSTEGTASNFVWGTPTAPQNTKSKDQCFTKEELQYPVTSVLARNEGKGEGLMQ
jgi:hypothetical protein